MPYLGKRGRVLLFFGGLDVIYSISLTVPDGETRQGRLFLWLSAIAPMWVWAAIWGVVGIVCLWQAFCRQDRIGYAAAIGLKIGWGLVCLGGWLFGHVDRGYVSAAIWLAAAFLVGVISGWPEPDDRRGPTWIRQPQ